ncbi:ankyrin-1-like [Olea europaea subsp. europaea]|uniref:Ankyrin-1-like n=2 Tax=Olea europaea subsp. europaea TaxID=158383 RepID=A0A8S0S1M9_OLEEU|nr:ankyrin-1-like [Olea europaea subsp. europaea]
MPPTYFPLRWESTGDQWWFASPIDWAAANGHYDLVRELLRLDGNHLIQLTSLRRIRRLETVWDDEEQFDDVAKCRSQVAKKLLSESESKKGKNSLIGAGYGGWLLYTAASAGDLGFVQELLERDPLLVFGEAEYGVTDILYAAARSKNLELFRIVFDFAASPRFSTGNGKEIEQQNEEIPSAYKWEMMNRALHAAARGGNLKLLKELLAECSDDLLAYRDIQGATLLHAAAARGQVELVKDLIASSDIISSVDNQGNTALHVAAHRGQLAVVEALILASPSSINCRNNAGETFLHAVVAGFQTPGFRRMDHQIELMKQLVRGKIFNIEEIVNSQNNDGRTALHLAIIGNVHSELVELLMTVRGINVNIRDRDGTTPLDILRQQPRSASSETLTRQLISAGGIFSCQDPSTTKVIASHVRRQSIGSSPGTSFRISDTEIFLYTGVGDASDGSHGAEMSTCSNEPNKHESSMENQNPVKINKPASVNYAGERLKRLLHWPKMKSRTKERLKKLVGVTHANTSDEVPIPLRQRFSKPSSLLNNKRALSVRSNQPSPAKKKLASGLMHGVMQSIPHTSIPRQSRSSSFSKLSLSSQSSLDAQRGAQIENEIAGTSCSNQMNDHVTNNSVPKVGFVNKRLMNQYLCFGASRQPVEAPSSGAQPYDVYERSVLSMA